MAPSDVGRSINPICQPERVDYAPPLYITNRPSPPPLIFRRSYGPVESTLYMNDHCQNRMLGGQKRIKIDHDF